MAFGNEKGASTVKTFLILFVLFAVIHVGLKWTLVHFDAWRLEDDIESKAQVGQVLKDGEIAYELEKRAADLGLPLTKDNFIVQRDEEKRTLTISTAWEVEVHYFWGICGEYCVRTYSFAPRGEGPLAGAGK